MQNLFPPAITRRKITPTSVVAFLLVVAGVTAISFSRAIDSMAHAAVEPGGLYIPNNTTVMPRAPGPTVYQHTFKIYNGLVHPVNVQARPSCSCLHVSWQSAQIRPLSSKDLSVSVHYDGSVVNQEKAVAIHTNRSKKPYIFVFFLSPN